GVDGDVLDAADVHRSAIDVAGEPGPTAAGRENDSLRQVRAIEHQRVPDEAAVARVDGVIAVAGVPDEGVVPRAAGQAVVPRAAAHGQPDELDGVRREQARGVHRVVAAEGVHPQRVDRAQRAGDGHKRKKARDGDSRRVETPRDLDGFASVGAVEDDGVGLANGQAGGAAQVQVEPVEVGGGRGGRVVDGDDVGAAEDVEVDLLDAAQVHGDAADVAGEPDARAVGRDVEPLGEVRAAEHQPVPDPALPFDRVAAVAGIPHERVVP